MKLKAFLRYYAPMAILLWLPLYGVAAFMTYVGGQHEIWAYLKMAPFVLVISAATGYGYGYLDTRKKGRNTFDEKGQIRKKY